MNIVTRILDAPLLKELVQARIIKPVKAFQMKTNRPFKLRLTGSAVINGYPNARPGDCVQVDWGAAVDLLNRGLAEDVDGDVKRQTDALNAPYEAPPAPPEEQRPLVFVIKGEANGRAFACPHSKIEGKPAVGEFALHLCPRCAAWLKAQTGRSYMCKILETTVITSCPGARAGDTVPLSGQDAVEMCSRGWAKVLPEYAGFLFGEMQVHTHHDWILK